MDLRRVRIGGALLLSLIALGCTSTQKASESVPQEQEMTGTSTLQLQAPQLTNLDDDDIGMMARIHYATHTIDFDRARAFYRTLGYTEGVTGFPLTNTHQMARSLGMFDICQYELAKGEVMALPGAANPASIDLLQFKIPFDDTPPYALPNHLGAAYAAFATHNFDSDVDTLERLGTEFLAEPHGAAGARFVFFKDPDGVLYKLEEASGESTPGPMHIFDMPYVALNVSNLERSLDFYARLGYAPIGAIQTFEGDATDAAAWGLPTMQFRTVDIQLIRGDQHKLRLTQWLAPRDLDPPYAPPINRIGINRIAVLVSHLDRAVEILKAQNVPFLSKVAPCCSGTGEDETGIVHIIDPDGIFVELVGAIEKRAPIPQPEGCPPLEIKYPEPEVPK